MGKYLVSIGRMGMAVLLSTSVCVGATAAELKVGFSKEMKSADPHVLDPAGRNLWGHVYETLLSQDAHLQPQPGLAVIWRPLDDLTWEFKLRPGVHFSDGTPFTAEDVKYSIERGLSLEGPRTYRTYLKDIKSVSAPDPKTVIIKTKTPDPGLPVNLAIFPIMSRQLGKDASEDSFIKGKAVGTGPYKFSELVKGERLVLAMNERYWDVLLKTPWSKVTFQFISKDPARASALLAGSVDVIDEVSSSLADTLKQSSRVEGMTSMTSYWLIFLQLDQFRDDSPFVKGNDGKPLGKNPFKDRRVRQALSYAINRDVIVKNVLKDDAEPAGQIVPPKFFGHDTTIDAPTYDANKAKALLREAGYPDGFRMTLHCSSDRYLNDAQVCEALGQMLTQVGVKTEVQTLPWAVYQTRSKSGANGDPEFSATVFGIGAATGDAEAPLTAIVQTYDDKAKTGANNRSRYSSKQVDALIEQASKSLNEAARRKALQQAAKTVMADVGIVPLHFLKVSWASRKGLEIKPRADGFTFASNVQEIGTAAKKKQ